MSTFVVVTFIIALASVRPSDSETAVHVDQPYIHRSAIIVPPQYVTKTGDDWNLADLECNRKSFSFAYAYACAGAIDMKAYQFSFPNGGDDDICDDATRLGVVEEVDQAAAGEGYDCDTSTITPEVYFVRQSSATSCEDPSPTLTHSVPYLARVCHYDDDGRDNWRVWFSSKNNTNDCYLIDANFETEAECQSYTYPTKQQVTDMVFVDWFAGEYPYFIGRLLDGCNGYTPGGIETYSVHPDFDQTPPFLCYNTPVCEFADIDAIEKDSDCNEYCHVIKATFCDDHDKDDTTMESFCKDVYHDCKERCRVYMDGGDCVNGEYL